MSIEEELGALDGEEESSDEDDGYCPYCNGSGEGIAPGSHCRWCADARPEYRFYDGEWFTAG